AACGFEQISSTDDFCDAHGGIVHHDRELIGGHVIAAPDDEVTEIASGEHALRAKAQVGKDDFFTIRNSKAPVDAGRAFEVGRSSATNWGTAAAGVKRFIIRVV